MKTITKKIRVHSLFVLLTFLLVHMSVFAGTSRIYTVDISILNEEETAAILSLQGLANREKPQILVLPKDKDLVAEDTNSRIQTCSVTAWPHFHKKH